MFHGHVASPLGAWALATGGGVLKVLTEWSKVLTDRPEHLSESRAKVERLTRSFKVVSGCCVLSAASARYLPIGDSDFGAIKPRFIEMAT
jgi:hypothetical protein